MSNGDVGGHYRGGNAGWGLILIAFGVVLLLVQLGVITHGFWRHGWPWIAIAVGAGQVALGRTAQALGSGVTTVLMGGWALAAETGWHGLTWFNSWPVSLVAIGAGMVTRWAASYVMPDRMRLPRREPSGEERSHD
jgi:hypothetical protein